MVWGPSRSLDAGQDTASLPRIICYGDSNTCGYCSEGRKFMPYGKALATELLSMGMPCEVAVCGLCNFTTKDMLNEKGSDCVRTSIGPSGRGLQRMLAEDGPVSLVIIMTGTNDMGFKHDLKTIVQHVAQLHSICHDRGVPTVAISPTQGTNRTCRSLRQQLADLISKWAGAATGVLDCLDVEDVLPRPAGKDGASSTPSAAAHWEPDDLHMSAAGSGALGTRLAPHVASWLQLSAASSGPVTNSKAPAHAAAPLSSAVATPLGQVHRNVGLSDKAAAISVQVSAALPSASRPSGGCGFAMANVQRQHRSARAAPFTTRMFAQGQVQLCR